MGQDQHGIVVRSILADVVLLDDLALGDLQLDIGTFGIQQVKVEILVPAVLLDGLQMLFGGVALAVIGGIAFDDCAADVLDDGLPEVGTQEVLVADLARMDLDGDLAGQLLIEQEEELEDVFRGDVLCKVNLGFHRYASPLHNIFMVIVYNLQWGLSQA